ncbi:MAG: DUF1207 domain-containing protein [Gemmatimonadota bacterium]|nr:DUF1207 domain-containing protein [Gemmatimonadota bacterium]
MVSRAALLFMGLLLLVAPAEALGQRSSGDGIAYPRRVRTFIGVYQEQKAPFSSQLVRMGLGDGLFLVGGRLGGLSYELELAAGVRGEFDVAVSSFDFLVADFIVGLPLRFRAGDLNGRVRLYHQSSHLGDDILLRDDARLGVDGAVDFEAIEAYLGYELGWMRPYAGAEYRFRRTPSEQDPSVLHAGMDVRFGLGRVSLIGGAHGWVVDNGLDPGGVAVRMGVEVHRSRLGWRGRPVRFLLEGSWGTPDAGRFQTLRRGQVGFAIEVGR